MTFIYLTAMILFILLCALLCGVILIQESKSSGLGASFGGDTTDSLFGASTADVLKKFTGWLTAIFLISCILLSVWTNAMGKTKIPQSDLPLIEEAQQ